MNRMTQGVLHFMSAKYLGGRNYETSPIMCMPPRLRKHRPCWDPHRWVLLLSLQRMVSYASGLTKGEYSYMISNRPLNVSAGMKHQARLSFMCYFISLNVHAFPGTAVGPVSALALSHDHTFVASGHATGHIQLFDLKNPQAPARSVSPTTLAAVASGRREGHLQGSRIAHIGFVAGRHTALVSADEHGLAFYHSLGKVLFVEASDILRLLGRYPDGPSIPISPISPATPGGSMPSRRRRKKNQFTILAMMPLPLGTSPHPTDAYNVVALLTPTKLVVVGLKPTPKTWFKRPRGVNEGGESRSKSRWKGTMAWFPSVSSNVHNLKSTVGRNKVESKDMSSNPILVYTWGNALLLIRVFETRSKQIARNNRTGKMTEIEVGRIEFEDAGKWIADDDILAVQWLNANVGSFSLIGSHNDSRNSVPVLLYSKSSFSPRRL